MSLWQYRPQPFTSELKYVDATTLALAEAAAITQSTGFDAAYGVVLVDEDEVDFVVEHGDTLTGDGTAADPLDTVFGNEVHHDNTLTGKGTTTDPLKVISGADSDATNLKDTYFISNNGLDANAGLNSTNPKQLLATVVSLLPDTSATYRAIKCDDVSTFVAPTSGFGLIPHERLVVDMPDCAVTGELLFTGNDNELKLGRVGAISIAYRTTLVVDKIVGGGVAALYFRTNEGGPQQSSVKCGLMGPGDEINLLNVIGEIHLEIDVYQADIPKMLSFIHADAIVTGWVGSHNFDAGIALKDTIYISNNGDDSATGTHPSRPKKDLGLVIDALPINSSTYRGIKCDDVSTFAAPTSNNGLIQHDHLTVDMPDATITGLISFDGNDNDIRIGHVEKINVAYRTNLVIDTIIGGGVPALYFRVGEGIPHNNSIKVRYMGLGDQLILQDVEGFIHLEIDVYESSIATMLSFINTDVVITGWVGSHNFGTIGDASATEKGAVQLATQAEVDAGTDTLKSVTPKTLNDRTATESRAGVVQLATVAEAEAGLNAIKAVSPLRMQETINLSHGFHYVQSAPQTIVTSTLETALEISFEEFDGRTPADPSVFPFVIGGIYQVRYEVRASLPSPTTVRVTCVAGNSATIEDNIKTQTNLRTTGFSTSSEFTFALQFDPTTGIKVLAYVGVNAGSVTLEGSTLTIVRIK